MRHSIHHSLYALDASILDPRRDGKPIITDRDPGDETPSVATYRATYCEENDSSIIFFRLFDARSFSDAVWQAEHAREDGERLINVRHTDDLDPITVSCQ